MFLEAAPVNVAIGLLPVADGPHTPQVPLPVPVATVEAAGVLAVDQALHVPVEDASGVFFVLLDPLFQLLQVPVDEASGVFLVLLDAPFQLLQVPVDEESGVFWVLLEPHGSQAPEEDASGTLLVAVVEQEVVVLVQTGTEMVQGQSVTVRVVLAVTV